MGFFGIRAELRVRLGRRRLDAPPLLLFDFDGVIADSLEVYCAEFAAACRELGYHKMSAREDLLKLVEGNAITELVKRGFPLWRLRALAMQFKPRIEAANARVAPFDGMPTLVAELAGRHPLYIITSNVTEVIDRFSDKHGIAGVREVLGSDKETSKVRKIRLVRKRHPDRQAWYIGDTKGDMLEARRAGAVTVAATWGWHPEETLRTAKPDHVVRAPEELRALFLEENEAINP